MVKVSPLKKKKCRTCKELFTPFSSLAVACSPMCAIEVAKEAKKKKARKRLKEGRERLKTLSDHLNEAQTACNAYIRERDGNNCISCGVRYNSTEYGGKIDCGHYRSVGSAPHLRFYTLNMSSQCVKCNRYLSGNSVEMRKGMVLRYGVALVDKIEADQRPRKYTADDLKRLTKIFKKKRKMLHCNK